jgi:hypothetical protein
VDVSVIVPFQSDCPHRIAAWDWVRASLEAEHPDWEIIVGTCPDGHWRKACALQDAIDRASGDRLVMHDADVRVHNLNDALNAGRVVVPHRTVWRLTHPETERFKAGGQAPFDTVRDPYPGRPCGGVLILDRNVWDEIPMDHRFQNWGQEDDSWALALDTILGTDLERDRLAADLIHLWHPDSPRMAPGSAYGSEANVALWRRYRDASGNPTAMRALLDEAREADSA